MFSQNHHKTAAAPAMFAALGADTHDRQDGEVVVRGKLPRGVSGVPFRNGPGRFRRGGETKRTVLDGDGVMQWLEIVDGIARYARRFVQTDKLVSEEAAGRFLKPSWTTTVPLTLANGLNDSPAGLAAWVIEKFQRWSDCDGDIERSFTKDELPTNVMIYWATQTAGSSFLPYYGVMQAGISRWTMKGAKAKLGSNDTPAGFAMFPKDISHPPRVWAERFFNVVRWTELPKGGHFAAMEQPQMLAEEIRAFFRPLRQARQAAAPAEA